MESTICMNDSCGATVTQDWKKGWPLRSGGFAHLCFNCGSAFENSVFCDKFHLEETGWRECHFCKKRVHCGCITSKALFEHLDYGGIGCINCLKGTQLHLFQSAETPTRFGMHTKNHVSESETTIAGERLFMDNGDEEKLMKLCSVMEANESNLQLQTQRDEIDSFSGKIDQKVTCQFGKMGTGLSNVIEPPFQPLALAKLEESNNGPLLENKDMLELSAQPSLCMSLGAPSGNSLLPLTSGVVEGREQGKASPFSLAQKDRTILPKPLKTSLSMNSETNKTSDSQLRIARPPADGRGKNQLLPRYWPRITDQELEQLSGNLNSTVIPLFEKQLSASDAGRIGRFVLPKACAEAYFPPINQSDGIPLKMQDVKGNEWTFQFRFWPNNNSRMYVLEGVTPCIQSMQLKAGDTVTFSRIDPGGKLVMGFRKSSSSADTQDASASAISNGLSSSGIFSENECNLSGNDAELLPEMKRSKVPDFSNRSENFDAANGDVGLSGSDNHRDINTNRQMKQLITVSEKRRTRNIGPKSKRLLIHHIDAQELKLTWDEALDLLRPPPSAKPSFVTIDDHVFEEYDEPPVFGKRTIFTARPSGEQDQWAQCDDCSKWRRLPVDILLPLKWTCSDNAWDTCRSTCSVPEELTPKELDIFTRTTGDSKKRRTLESNRYTQEHEPTGLDALASAAVMGENVGDSGEPSAGATTKHPRHRPGCTCIVCIQPPSGKGKHKPSCTCNVCLTVKRRFKTLMLRKKKRQSEREAAAAQKENNHQEDDRQANTRVEDPSLHTLDSQKKDILNKIQQPDLGETSAGDLDLNYHPHREENQSETIHLLKMMSRIETYSHQVEDNKQPNGSTSYLSNQETSAEPNLLQQSTAGEVTEDVYDEYLFSRILERSIQFRQKN